MEEWRRIRRNKQLAVLLYHQMVCLACLYFQKKKRKQRARPIVRNRLTHGEGSGQVADMYRLNDGSTFFESFRMSATIFEELLNVVGPTITKQHTQFRASVSPCERLLVALRYLATGDDQTAIAASYRLGKSTVNAILKSTCIALWDVLLPDHMPLPTEETWKEMAEEFWNRWDFPNCVGAIDEKHVRYRSPFSTGGESFTYKGVSGVVVTVVADARSRITLLDVVESERERDGDAFSSSTVGTALSGGSLNVPPSARVPGKLDADRSGVLQNRPVLPHVIVGDETYPLRENLLRPFPNDALDATSRIFNYRLGAARRTAENVYGVLAARWRFYLRIRFVQPDRLKLLVKASCILHNFLLNREASEAATGQSYCPSDFADRVIDGRLEEGQWRTLLDDREKQDCSLFARRGSVGSNVDAVNSASLRSAFAKYFTTEDGEVPWQYEQCLRDEMEDGGFEIPT